MVDRAAGWESRGRAAHSGARYTGRTSGRPGRRGCWLFPWRRQARDHEGQEGAMTDHAGFSLVEMLLAALIILVVLGAAFELAAPAQRMFQAQPEVSDVQQRMRVAVEAIRTDLVM